MQETTQKFYVNANGKIKAVILNETERTYFVENDIDETEDGVYVSKEVFDIIISGLKKHDWEVAFPEPAFESNPNVVDNTYLDALRYCIQEQKASVSLIQRRFPIGYMKSCKIIDWMETNNYVVRKGNKLTVILTKEEYGDIYGEFDT